MTRRPIDQINFKELFNKPGKIVEIENYTIRGDCIVGILDFKCIGAIIKGCEFEDNIEFNNANISEGIRFDDVTFEKQVFFISLKSKKKLLKKLISHITLDFYNIRAVDFVIHDNKFDRCIKIVDSDINSLIIEGNEIFEEGFYISESKIINHFQIFDNNFTQDFKIYNSIISSQLKFSDNRLSSYVFQQSIFKKKVWIWAGEAKKGIIFNDGIYEDEFRIEAVKSEGNLVFVGDEFKKSCFIEFTYKDNKKTLKGGFKDIYIKSAKFNDTLEIKDSDNEDIIEIPKLTIEASSQLTGDIRLNNLKIIETKITGGNYKANISFDNVEFGTLELNKFANYSSLSFNSLKTIEGSQKKLIIKDSKLSNVSFENFDFNVFESITFYKANLEGIKCSNIKWFTADKLKVQEDSLLNEWQLKRELFMQLKAEMRRQANSIQARYFKKQELKSHLKELKYSEIKNWKEGFRNYIDRFLLFTNKSNDFGENWFRPVWLSFIATAVFYFLIVFTIDPRLGFIPSFEIGNMKSSLIAVFSDNIHAWPQLFNPVHSLVTIFGATAKLSFWTHFWDILQRIFMSYFIYQTISAFRKYTG